MRRGDLGWRLTIPPDGHLPAGGLLPALIEWDTSGHPARRLPDSGCHLTRLRLTPSDPETGSRALEVMGCRHLVCLAPQASAAPPPHDRRNRNPQRPAAPHQHSRMTTAARSPHVLMDLTRS